MRSELGGGALLLAQLRFASRATRLLARYPSVLLQVPRGFARATHAMEQRVSERYRRDPRTSAVTGGARIHLNPGNTLAQNASMAIAGWYEPPVTELLRALSRPGGVVIDVGANVGWYTFLAAAGVGPQGRVVGIEPDPENYRLLSLSLAENPRGQIQLCNECLSDHDGTELLYLSDEAASYHSISRAVGTRSIPVVSERLDSLIERNRLSSVVLVKIDVEGGEPKVIRGGLGAIHSGRIENIILEWRSESWAAERSLWADLTANYDVFRLVSSPRLRVRIFHPTLEAVDRETRAAGIHGADLFLSRRR